MNVSFFFAPGSIANAALAASCSIGLLLLTTGMHHEALRLIRLGNAGRAGVGRARTVLVLLGISAAHLMEVLAYAVAYYVLTRFLHAGMLGGFDAPSLDTALYFSLETYSSLGYGDIVPSGALRGVAGAEALNGLLLIGWSACYVHGALDF
jgi:hypothetical protein